MMLTCKTSYYFSGHHETPPEAHTKILEKFPNSLPRNQGNVIPPAADKKVEEVCYFWDILLRCIWMQIFLRSLSHYVVEGKW